jgi:phosphoribosyl 1,2-cyclic phosphodiesterase
MTDHFPRSHALPSAAPATTVQSLGSGSSGNGFLITSGETVVLLDCGVGIRTINAALRERGRAARSLDAILVTHEHSDHVRTLSAFAGRDVPIVSTAGTRRRAFIAPPQWEEISFARPVHVGALTVWAIKVRHDAAEPCGFLIEAPDTRVAVFTDLGCWHDRVGDAIRAADLVVLESNHDLEMLHRGPYPAHLKRRVASDVGHLSNADCAASLASVLGHVTSPTIWLAHLSETNNRPAVAEAQTVDALAEVDLRLDVLALPRRTPGPVWQAGGARATDAWSPTPRVPASLQLKFDALL